MGLGDQLIATGMARGAAARGVRIALGDGKRIRWDHNSEIIFRNNPNIARPGLENLKNLEWVKYYKGHRIYNSHDGSSGRWTWNYNFKVSPGELFFTKVEAGDGRRFDKGFVLFEPNIEDWKSVAANKDWGKEKYQTVAENLKKAGYRVCQFSYPKAKLSKGFEHLVTRNFRDALSILSHAALYVGPEGGLHHGAAALNVPAVVLFGGFIPVQITGYESHINLVGSSKEACGSLSPCEHCRQAMESISIDEVTEACLTLLKRQ